MKKTVRAQKLTLSKLTLQKLTVDQLADAKGGARDQLPVTSQRVDCGCA